MLRKTVSLKECDYDNLLILYSQDKNNSDYIKFFEESNFKLVSAEYKRVFQEKNQEKENKEVN